MFKCEMGLYDMIVNLEKYFLSDDAEDSLRFCVDLKEIEIDGVYPFPFPVDVQADLKSFSNSVLLDIKFSYIIQKPCDRCLEVAKEEYSEANSYVIVTALNEEDQDGRYILAENKLLNLDELVYSSVITEFPTKFLCSSDCKGLCPMCGQNLNEGDCSCDKKQVDPRLEVLRQLMDHKE